MATSEREIGIVFTKLDNHEDRIEKVETRLDKNDERFNKNERTMLLLISVITTGSSMAGQWLIKLLTGGV